MYNFLSITTGEENISPGNLKCFTTVNVLQAIIYTTPELQATTIKLQFISLNAKADVDIADSSSNLFITLHESNEGLTIYKFLS